MADVRCPGLSVGGERPHQDDADAGDQPPPVATPRDDIQYPDWWDDKPVMEALSAPVLVRLADRTHCMQTNSKRKASYTDYSQLE